MGAGREGSYSYILVDSNISSNDHDCAAQALGPGVTMLMLLSKSAWNPIYLTFLGWAKLQQSCGTTGCPRQDCDRECPISIQCTDQGIALPQAIALVGEFNDWTPEANHWAVKNDFGVWTLFLPDNADGTAVIPHR